MENIFIKRSLQFQINAFALELFKRGQVKLAQRSMIEDRRLIALRPGVTGTHNRKLDRVGKQMQ